LVTKGLGPNKLGAFRDGGRGLAVTEDRILTLAAGRVISYSHLGSKAEVATARYATRPLFVVHSGRAFLAAGRALLSVQGAAASVLDELAVDITGLTAREGRLYVAATSELKVYDLEGKNLATFAVPPTRSLTTDGVSLFGITHNGVYRVSPTGGEADILWDQGSPSGLVVTDRAHVYFHDGDELKQLDKSGGTPRSMTKVGPALSALTADEGQLYWALDQRKAQGSGPGGVFRMAKAGGEPENLAPEARQVTALALSGRRLIWIEEYGDTLMALSLD